MRPAQADARMRGALRHVRFLGRDGRAGARWPRGDSGSEWVWVHLAGAHGLALFLPAGAQGLPPFLAPGAQGLADIFFAGEQGFMPFFAAGAHGFEGAQGLAAAFAVAIGEIAVSAAGIGAIIVAARARACAARVRVLMGFIRNSGGVGGMGARSSHARWSEMAPIPDRQGARRSRFINRYAGCAVGLRWPWHGTAR